MIFIDELSNLKLYKKPFYLPRSDKDKRKGQAVLLLTPNVDSSVKLMNFYNLMLKPYYNSYYLEKNISLFINEQMLYEGASNFIDNSVIVNEAIINEGYSRYISKNTIKFHGSKTSVNMLYSKVLDMMYYNCNKLNVKITTPVDVYFVNDYEGSDNNTKKELYLPEYDTLDNEDKYIEESIINFLINYKYSKINKNIVDAVSLVYSGLFDELKDDFIDPNQYALCMATKNLYESDPDFRKVNKIIRDNDIRELASYMKIAQLDLLDEAKGYDPLRQVKALFSNIKRKITMKSRKGGAHKIKKVEDEIQSTNNRVKPNATIPNVSSSSSKEELKNIGEESIEYNDATITEDFIQIGDTLTYFDEASANNNKLRNILYKERLRNTKEVMRYYNDIKQQCPFIQNTYVNLLRYKSLNLFVDLSFYNNIFFKNNSLNGIKGADLYFDLMGREINNIKLKEAGYNQKTVLIPVKDWSDIDRMWMIKKDVNVISVIYNMLYNNLKRLQDEFGDTDFVFLGDKSYFKLSFNECNSESHKNFLILIKRILNNQVPTDEEEGTDKLDSAKAIKASIKDDIEDKTKVVLIKKSLTGETNKEVLADGTEKLKEEINNAIDKAAEESNSKEDALKKLSDDEEFKAMILDLSTASVTNNGPEMSKSRLERNSKLQKEVLNKKVKGKTVEEIINDFEKSEDKLEPMKLNVSAIDNSWNELTYPSQAVQYNPDSDIIRILMSFANKTYPVNIVDIQLYDTSTSEDYIYTYEVKMESYNSKRFTLKFDVPKMKDNQYFLLRGNKKTINAQSFLLPITKTGPNTAQIVSNYSKIFIETYGTSTGKSFIYADKIIRGLDKYKGKNTSFAKGDCSGISFLYDLPIDYIDLGSSFRYIENKQVKIYFNQEEIRKEYADVIDLSKGIPFAVDKTISNKKDSIVYYQYDNDANMPITYLIYNMLSYDQELYDILFDIKPSTRYTYSKASILSTHIPLIVLCGYHVGIIETMNRAGVDYEIVEKRNSEMYKNGLYDFIKFSDGYIKYANTLKSSLLMNGLKECDTENYSIKDINSKFMYMEFLDKFGGRIKSDGLDNFYDLMIDPITYDILEHSALPDNYIDLLLYANEILADNRYIQHADISDGKRIRRNELIAGYAYKALSSAYGSYAIQAKHGRDVPISMKQSAIIDLFLQDPTAGDLSIINPLGEQEAYATISSKGLSGMNADRAYGLAERNYHDSMKGIYAMSTGFAANVGVNRQLTVNASIDGVRGYVDPLKSNKDMNTANTLCMTEALSPFITTRDDPFRTAMTFIQTSKHSLRTTKSDPLLVTYGADQVLPHLVSNVFCTKSKFNGKVTEITDTYMIVTEDLPANSKEKPRAMYVDLTEKVEKNSSSGFYVVIKQSTDLKVGSKVKAGDIIAYDKSCFGDDSGADDNITYDLGVLAKCAILNTDEGFEDSAMISQGLAKALGTQVVVLKAVDIDRNTNIYNVIKKGTPVEEGDTLMIMQNSYDEEDANKLLKNLADDDESISALGRVPIKSKITGVVQDIKIYRTVELDELSDSLKKLCMTYENNIEKTKKIMKSNNIDQLEELDANYKLPMTGKLKNTDGVRIEFYLMYYDIMAVGDKMIYTNALKGVNKGLFPVGQEPYSEFRKDERIDSMLPISSINARMVSSVPNIGSIDKVLVELSRKIKDMAGIKYNINLTDPE